MRLSDNCPIFPPFVLDFKPGITSCHYKNCSLLLLCLNSEPCLFLPSDGVLSNWRKKVNVSKHQAAVGALRVITAQAKSWASQIIGGITDIFGRRLRQSRCCKKNGKTSRLDSIWLFGPWFMCINVLFYYVDCLHAFGLCPPATKDVSEAATKVCGQYCDSAYCRSR